MICAPSEDSDQPGHPPSLIRVFAVHSVGGWGPNVSSCEQQRLIRLGGCPGWSESSLGAKVILLALSWGGSFHHVIWRHFGLKSGIILFSFFSVQNLCFRIKLFICFVIRSLCQCAFFFLLNGSLCLDSLDKNVLKHFIVSNTNSLCPVNWLRKGWNLIGTIWSTYDCCIVLLIEMIFYFLSLCQRRQEWKWIKGQSWNNLRNNMLFVASIAVIKIV